jgi:hypothetical protein
MNKVYKLKATLGNTKRWIHVVASDDSQAMMESISYILSEAMSKEVWAKGYIELVSPAGEVVETMGAK